MAGAVRRLADRGRFIEPNDQRGTGNVPRPPDGLPRRPGITEVSAREVAEFLRSLAESGAKPMTVNKYRQLILAGLNYATRDDSHTLPMNPCCGRQ